MNAHQRRTRWRAIVRDPGYYSCRIGSVRIWQKRPTLATPYNLDVGMPEVGFVLPSHPPLPKEVLDGIY